MGHSNWETKHTIYKVDSCWNWSAFTCAQHPHTHATMLLPPFTHTHTQASCADADCAVDDAFAAWRWREEDRVANGASFMRNVRWLTCCIRASPRRVLCQTLVVPLCACMCVWVNVRMWVRGCHNHLRIAGATNSPYSVLLLLLDFCTRSERTTLAKNAARFLGKLH